MYYKEHQFEVIYNSIIVVFELLEWDIFQDQWMYRDKNERKTQYQMSFKMCIWMSKCN